ncbi:hypothetical protein HGA64_03220 [Candidatus Falkowbacteria bacterium]|nr:hypothetical protein [Candidatus Falkowbacteria bacterium]
MSKISLSIFILVIALSVVVFGCAKKDSISDGQIPDKSQNSVASSTKDKQASSSSSPVKGNDAVATSSDVSTTPENLDVSKWNKYENKKYGFELKFPASWRIKHENKSLAQTQLGTEDGSQSVWIDVNKCSFSTKFKYGSYATIGAGEGGCEISIYTIVKLSNDNCAAIRLKSPSVYIDEDKCVGIFRKIDKSRLVNHMSAQSAQLNESEVPNEARVPYDLLVKIVDTFHRTR